MKYNLSIIIIHWVMALLVISMISSGFYMTNLSTSNEFKFTLYTAHKACGITILILVIIRLIFRIFTYIPPFPTNFSKLTVYMSKTVHFCLYSLMAIVPLSGYIMSSASSREIKYLFHIPLLIKHNKELASTAREIHSLLAYFIIFLICLHIVGVIKHIFIDKQNILKRII